MAYTSETALLAGTIDYAGMFPPASLSLSDTLKRAATFRKDGHHPWLFNKVVLNLSELITLTPKLLFEAGADGTPWLYSALASPKVASAGDTDSWIQAIEWDQREIGRFNSRYEAASCRQTITSYEAKLPEKFSDSWILALLDRLDSSLDGSLDLFLESGWEGNWKTNFQTMANTLSSWMDEADDSPVMAGVKIRTGGKYTPTPDQVASVIDICRQHSIPLKATQGMHSPVSHDNQFGFVNYFAALVFGYHFGAEEMPVSALSELLADSQKKNFRFSESSFSWKDFQVSTEEIERTRRIYCGTFGSCSLDEPDQFLLKEFP